MSERASLSSSSGAPLPPTLSPSYPLSPLLTRDVGAARRPGQAPRRAWPRRTAANRSCDAHVVVVALAALAFRPAAAQRLLPARALEVHDARQPRASREDPGFFEGELFEVEWWCREGAKERERKTNGEARRPAESRSRRWAVVVTFRWARSQLLPRSLLPFSRCGSVRYVVSTPMSRGEQREIEELHSAAEEKKE